jgi:hypothetical protein
MPDYALRLRPLSHRAWGRLNPPYELRYSAQHESLAVLRCDVAKPRQRGQNLADLLFCRPGALESLRQSLGIERLVGGSQSGKDSSGLLDRT